MHDDENTRSDIKECLDLLRDRLGVRSASMADAAPRCKRLMPRQTYAAVQRVAAVEPFLDHPRLRLTVDTERVAEAVQDVRSHLRSVDVADRRKGWWLGMLGGLAFNMLALASLVIVVLVWRGFL